MDDTFDAAYSCPDAWQLAPDASDGSLTMVTSHGSRLLLRLPDFHGSCYLRPTDELAGFAFFLTVPPATSRRLGRGDQRPRSLFWEAVDLSHRDSRNFSGEGRLRLDDREVWTTVNGQIASIPCHGSMPPYLRVLLSTEFRAVGLGWPRPAAWRLKRVQLHFFTEIHRRRRTDRTGAPG